ALPPTSQAPNPPPPRPRNPTTRERVPEGATAKPHVRHGPKPTTPASPAPARGSVPPPHIRTANAAIMPPRPNPTPPPPPPTPPPRPPDPALPPTSQAPNPPPPRPRNPTTRERVRASRTPTVLVAVPVARMPPPRGA